MQLMMNLAQTLTSWEKVQTKLSSLSLQQEMKMWNSRSLSGQVFFTLWDHLKMYLLI